MILSETSGGQRGIENVQLAISEALAFRTHNRRYGTALTLSVTSELISPIVSAVHVSTHLYAAERRVLTDTLKAMALSLTI